MDGKQSEASQEKPWAVNMMESAEIEKLVVFFPQTEVVLLSLAAGENIYEPG